MLLGKIRLAAAALVASRRAHRSAVSDQKMRQIRPVLARRFFHEIGFNGFLGFGFCQAQTMTESDAMRINRDPLDDPVRRTKDDGGRFAPDTAK